MPTHEVFNQPPPLEGYDALQHDHALVEGLVRHNAEWAMSRVRDVGLLMTGEAMAWGFQANRFGPELRTFDRFGHRIDEVEFHPAWHRLMESSVAHGLHALPWQNERPGAHVARVAMGYLMTQAESGHGCPITMTFASVPALRAQPEVAEEWVPRFTSSVYDPRCIPASQKKGALCGMAMTEKQGGSDVRANTTQARPLGSATGAGAEYAIVGHKWFCSAPMCDAFLTLAHTERGLSCFLLPRWRPDGTRNAFHIQRLKDKLGDRSNASSEVEFTGAWARMIGEEGRGVKTIIEMVSHTRLDCVMGSAGIMRHAVAQATHHAEHRSAFGKKLTDQPLMLNVLADLAIEQEAATMLLLRLAQAYDDGVKNPEQRAFARIATAIAKYWVCKRTPHVLSEALECHGGSGYVEESVLPRLYRQAPLNSIWEGSGNVMCLDVLRAMGREPDSVPALFAELALARGADRHLDGYIERLTRDLSDLSDIETRGRALVERLALALQASLVVRYGQPAMVEAFVRSRIQGEHGAVFGTLPVGVDCRGIVDRARPRVG
ncbi:acyl-CoA dehydrogenase family protein [Pendulispora albinea]|uniref:Acyl-CoA dehydrogenase family protein n=1 Tax=Pendulispora albinea TaxID=2741071 RepID=A0ABZ2LQX7_9BACT